MHVSNLFSFQADQPCSIKSTLVHHDYCVTINLFRSVARPFPSIYLCRMQNWTKRQGNACQPYVSATNVIAISLAVAGCSCTNIDGSPWRNHETVSSKLVYDKKVYRGSNVCGIVHATFYFAHRFERWRSTIVDTLQIFVYLLGNLIIYCIIRKQFCCY